MKYFFTSVNNAYIPKAIILAESLRHVYGGEAHITCMLSDTKRKDIDYSAFDEVLTIEELALPVASLEAWIFKHTVVELCTAVKPWAFKTLFTRHNADAVIYMDPDTVVWSPLHEVHTALPEHPVILTPHVTRPAPDENNLLDGEMLGSLRHGVFNLGFLALAAHGDGVAFLDWWARRCLDWCYDDKARGLFTDQRWIDLAPCFFPNILILRHAGYNTASWNLYYRRLSRDARDAIHINESEPLRFFHFSGHDIGTHLAMLEKYAPADRLLHEMNDWYIAEQDRHGQQYLGRRPGACDFFSNGESIPREARVAYREDATLMQRFPKPYSEPGYRQWLATRTTTRTPPSLLRQLADWVHRRPRLAEWLKLNLPEQWLARVRRQLKR